MTKYLSCMTMMSFRVDEHEADEIRQWAEQLGVDRSQLLRDATHRYLVALASERDAQTWQRQPLTVDEEALAGVADWGPSEEWADWADAAR